MGVRNATGTIKRKCGKEAKAEENGGVRYATGTIKRKCGKKAKAEENAISKVKS